MATSASQIEVQAPPGLESFGQSASVLPSDLQEQEFKESLANEVTQAVREHVEQQTAAVVDRLWKKGQRTIQTMQQEQLIQAARLQSQLDACAEAHKQLESENTALRQGLEALLRHLNTTFAAAQVLPPTPPSRLRGLNAAGARAPASVRANPSTETVTITLRRGDNIPVGLELQPDDENKLLHVLGIRPGGAVEAWNRQCFGDGREVRIGDCIISINGQEGVELMRQECLTKLLLKITMIRQTCAPGDGRDAATSTEGGSEAWAFRADAAEFVPKSN